MLPRNCSFCDHENPAGSKYCNDCGSPLHLALCECGAVNDLTDTRCYRCGTYVSGPRAPAQGMPLEAQLGEDEEQLRGFERQLDEPEEHASKLEPQPAGDAPAPAQDVRESERQPREPMRAAQAPAQDLRESERQPREPMRAAPAPAQDVREPERQPREPMRAAQAPAQDVRESERQPREPMRAAGSSKARAPALLAGDPGGKPRGRRHGYVAAAFVLVIAVAVAAGVSFYDRYAPMLDLAARAPRGPAAVAPSPVTGATGGSAIAGVSPRAGKASTLVAPIVSALQATDVPIESRAEGDTGSAPSPGTGGTGGSAIAGVSPPAGKASTLVAPIVSALQAIDAPIESRAAGDTGNPSAPISAPPVPDPRCPPAVAAMALCERMAHADRR